MDLSQRSLYSAEPSTKGFNLSAGKTWIYPENYPVRDYQFSIVESALYRNTLVCLPTGLGKTFIAAVVMFNYWRWYPQGKIVFLAPTKPLVAQQIQACHDIMGIPGDDSIELTGATGQKKRQLLWKKYRVIFATPQVFHKDLEKNILPGDLVKCVVVDEAHRALGKHSYCESIRLLSEQNQYFRVLGLSATPGGKLDDVQEVVRNLHIAHLELRDDTSPDIMPYIKERKFEIISVSLGAELERYKDSYITIMDRHVRVLIDNNILRGTTGNISKGRIYHILKEWENKNIKGGSHGIIMKTLTILMTMYHAYELMVRHGLRAFYDFYQLHKDKFWLSDEQPLCRLLEDINDYLGPFPDVRPLPDGTLSDIPDDIRFGHEKFQKLKEILVRHFESFQDKEEETRAIVFVEYRAIVNDVYVLLLQSRPLLRPQKFVGQAVQKQREQKRALEDFRNNKVNVLISTSVGEEGLDVGEVDLIICFDISHKSPTRLVQRMGRTGRKRDGHIIALVSDGKEYQTLMAAMSRRDSLNNKVLQSSATIQALHDSSPRMVPLEFQPECSKMHIAVQPKSLLQKAKGKMQEPKKSRKKAEPPNNTKLSEPSASTKSASQSSLVRFLTKPEVDNAVMAIGTQQSLKNNNTIKLSQVKLLSSDNAAADFLTLCTMKKSQNEQSSIDDSKTNPYLPSNRTRSNKIEMFLQNQIPDMKILDCLKNITDYVEPSIIKDESVPAEYYDNSDDVYWDDAVVGYNDMHDRPEDTKLCLRESKFEALLDDSSDDSDAITVLNIQDDVKGELPVCEQADWGVNNSRLGFENLLNESDSWSSAATLLNENVSKSNVDVEISSKFEAILDSSSTGSETDFSLPGSPKVKVNDSESPEKMSTAKQLKDEITDEVCTSPRTYLTPAPQGPTLRTSFDILPDNESPTIDLLMDSKSNALTQIPKDVRKSRDSKIMSDSQKISANDQETIDTECDALDRNVKIAGAARMSPVFPDRPLCSLTARSSGACSRETAEEIPLLQINEQVEKSVVVSDDDIFGVDDLMEDSDFEEQISITEKSLETKVNTDFKDLDRSFATPQVVDQNLDEYDWDSDLAIKHSPTPVTPRGTLENGDSAIESTKNSGSCNITEAAVTDMIFQDCDWDSDFEAISSVVKPLANFSNKIDVKESPKACGSGAAQKNTLCVRSSQDRDKTDWISVEKLDRRTSISNKLANNVTPKATDRRKDIRRKLLTKRIARRPLSKSDSDSENEFAVARVETSALKSFESDYFAKPNPVDKIRKSDPTEANDHSNVTTRKPLSIRRDEINKISLDSLRDSFANPKNKQPNGTNNNNRNLRVELEKSTCVDLDSRKKKNEHRKDRRGRVKNDFIDDEAEVSTDGDHSAGTSGTDDEDLDGFVSYTQNFNDSEDMKAHYLQTVRSPHRARGFHIRQPKDIDPNIQIFSQALPNETNEYLHDSFCVAEDEVFRDSDETSDEFSILEILERKLKNKKRKRVDRNELPQKRRRRIIEPTNTSTEDEIE